MSAERDMPPSRAWCAPGRKCPQGGKEKHTASRREKKPSGGTSHSWWWLWGGKWRRGGSTFWGENPNLFRRLHRELHKLVVKERPRGPSGGKPTQKSFGGGGAPKPGGGAPGGGGKSVRLLAWEWGHSRVWGEGGVGGGKKWENPLGRQKGGGEKFEFPCRKYPRSPPRGNGRVAPRGGPKFRGKFPPPKGHSVRDAPLLGAGGRVLRPGGVPFKESQRILCKCVNINHILNI